MKCGHLVRNTRLTWFRFKEQAINGGCRNVFSRGGCRRNLTEEVLNMKRYGPLIPTASFIAFCFSHGHKVPQGAFYNRALMFHVYCVNMRRNVIHFFYLFEELVKTNFTWKSGWSRDFKASGETGDFIGVLRLSYTTKKSAVELMRESWAEMHWIGCSSVNAGEYCDCKKTDLCVHAVL